MEMVVLRHKSWLWSKPEIIHSVITKRETTIEIYRGKKFHAWLKCESQKILFWLSR